MFGDLVRRHRLRLGLTQEGLAARTGLSPRTIRSVEAGHIRRPRPATVRLLADAFGLAGTDRDQFHSSVLPSDADLAPTPGTPAQLPTDLSTFAGRQDELTELLAVGPAGEARAVVVSAIDGMAGIGKTALAVHASHRLTERYPDGQLFVNLHGFTPDVTPVRPADALDRMLRALGASGEDIPPALEERAALFRSQLASRRMLILLDDAAGEDQVRPLLPGAPGCLVLITSRRRLTGLDDVRPLSLDVLPLPDAMALFTNVAGAQRLAGEPRGLVAEAVELCGRLPLAVRIAAARLRARPAWTLAYLVDRLRDQPGRIAELEVGQRSVATSFRLSHDQLPPGQQRVFRLLGRHPGTDFDGYAAAALAGTRVREVAGVLEELVDAHLLESHRPGRYRFHDLVRLFAAEQDERAAGPVDGEAAVARLLTHLLSTARRASDAIWPNRRLDGDTEFAEPEGWDRRTFAGPAEALAWLDAERANLVMVAGQVAGAPPATARFVVHLARTIMWYLTEGGYWSEWESLCTHAAAVAERLGDRSGQAMALAGLARLSHHRQDLPAAIAYLHRGLLLRREIGDRRGEGVCLCNLGIAYTELGDLGMAETCLTESLYRRREVGDPVGEAITRNSLANLYVHKGSYPEAYEHLRHSLRISRECGDPSGEAAALIAIGRVHAAVGRLDEAQESLDAGLSVCRETGNRDKAHEGLIARATVLRRLGRPAEADADLAAAAALDQGRGTLTLGQIPT